MDNKTTMKNIKSNYDLQLDSARNIFLQYDQDFIIKKFQLQANDSWIYLEYFHTPCRINRKTGEIEEFLSNDWKLCKTFGTIMTIYDLLCYSQGESIPSLSGQWCTVGNFVMTGVQDTSPFTKKFASLFNGRMTELKEACEAIGGIIQPRMAGADVTCIFPVTSFFPVLLQFWDGDEEFNPKVVLLWDKNTIQFLHFETTFYLQGDLLERLKEWIAP